MVIETKYDYTYYTVLDQDWFNQAERTLTIELTSERIVNAINSKLKRSNDSSLNCFRVDYIQHSDDIEQWVNRNLQHKECPVFVQIENNQPIITSGTGTLFVFYEEQDDDENDDDEDDHHLLYMAPDALVGLSGRL